MNDPKHEDFSVEDQPHEEETQRTPRFLSARPGRLVSWQGMVERVIEQFRLEHGTNESEAVQEATTAAQRRGLVRDAALYIFAVESVQLSPAEQAQIIGTAYSELFGFGPLDPYFEDEQVVTIALEGVNKLSVRYGAGADFTPREPIFEDIHHLRRILRRLLQQASADFQLELPVIEVGLMVEDRRVSVSVAVPPYAPELAADIRVHPAERLTLDDLVTSNFMDDIAQQILEAIAKSEYGIVIVGQPESGKTTLLNAMLPFVSGENLVSVERAGELRLPEQATRLVPIWPVGEQEMVSFGAQIRAALELSPQTLLLDEVRADEPGSIAPLLQSESGMRQIWSFRGAVDPKRLRNALGMLARRAAPGQSEIMVQELYQRLPFVISVTRRGGSLQLRGIAEWQNTIGDTTEFVTLWSAEEGMFQRTGKKPSRTLELPEDFWSR